MSEPTIRTNFHHYDVLYWWDLTKKEQREFSYLETEQEQQDASFFRYRGDVYDLSEFERVPPTFTTTLVRQHGEKTFPTDWKLWDGYQSDSFFSGILVRYVEHFERVIIATYFS
jgi:hypothetical protein